MHNIGTGMHAMNIKLKLICDAVAKLQKGKDEGKKR